MNASAGHKRGDQPSKIKSTNESYKRKNEATRLGKGNSAARLPDPSIRYTERHRSRCDPCDRTKGD